MLYDDSTIQAGLTPQARIRMDHWQKKHDAIWQKAQHFAISQPFTSSLLTEKAWHDAQMLAKDFQQYEHLVVIGTGGASLGGHALCALHPQAHRVHFLRNCDAHTVQQLLQALPLTRTAFVMVSKSGETVETLAIMLAVMAFYEAKNTPLLAVAAITEEGENSARLLAQGQGWPVLCHPHDLGGRFSAFSVVGMFPLLFLGVDVAALLQQVDTRLVGHLRAQPARLFIAASWFAASLPEQPMHVLFAYADRLKPLAEWYAQLWAESLGKDLTGPTPVTAIGAIDQHSQLQLYLGGPRDKLFTLLTVEDNTDALPLWWHDALPERLHYLQQARMQDVMRATAQATVDTMRAHHIPLRVVSQPFQVEDTALLMADMVLEVLLVAAMMGVDPFSQPTVEEGKNRTRSMLAAARNAQ